MSNRIFISYRREDSRGSAGRLYDQLAAHFGRERIFMDVDTIQPGLDFVEAIESAVGQTDAMIVVIGPDWLGAVDAVGNRRLDNPEDFVRLEIAAGLERNVRVIPVLVKRAEMPRSTELPDDLKALSRRNALELSHARFNSDAQRLINALELALEQAEADRQEEAMRIEAERAEGRRLEKEKEEAERQRLAAEKAEAEQLAAEKATGERTASGTEEVTASSIRKAPSPHRTRRNWLPAWGWAIIILVPVALFGLWIVFIRDNGTPSDATPTRQAAVERAATVTRRAFEAELTVAARPTDGSYLPPPNAELGDSWTRPVDGMEMVYVPPPDAPFVLESGVDAPQDGYWIDRYEVSNAQYESCVDADACDPSGYADNENYNEADYPVVGVSWFDAADYSAWVGGALPTEGEWEYAAVGDSGMDYPWGDEASCDLANYWDCVRGPVAVDSYPEGASWVGALNMAGNVWEWTASRYEGSESRVLRGGSWANDHNYARAAARNNYSPLNRNLSLGFRVVARRSPSQ